MYANILKKAAAQKEDQNAEENIDRKRHVRTVVSKNIHRLITDVAALGELSRLPCYW